MNHFYALMSRMKYIDRWSLMRNSQGENIAQHSLDVSMVAHAMALLGNARLGKHYDAQKVALIGMYHDSNEIITGDLPTPVKYSSPEMRDLFHKVEDRASRQLMDMLPEDIRDEFEHVFFKAPGEEELWRLVKGADRICALIKCVEEAHAGNHEFDKAKVEIEESIHKMNLPEADMFLEEFLPSYGLTLDELLGR